MLQINDSGSKTMSDGQRGMNNKVKRWFSKNAVLVFLLAVIVVFSLLNSTFLTSKNILNLVAQMSINALIAAGMTYVIITAGIDISVGSVAAFAGILSAYLGLATVDFVSNPFGALAIQLFAALVVGVVCGLFNGIMITKFRVVPMIATLAMMSIARGFAYVVTDGKPVYGLPDSFAWLGSGRVITTESMPQGVIPIIVIFTLIVVLSVHLLLTKTVFGRHVFAVGSNEKVAHLAGINVAKVKIKSYILCSVMAGLAGVCVTSKLNNGQPASCEGYEMYAIAATVLGGTSFEGGVGSVARAMIGVAIIAIINNGLNLVQVSSYWQKVVTGAIILLAIIVDMSQKRVKN